MKTFEQYKLDTIKLEPFQMYDNNGSIFAYIYYNGKIGTIYPYHTLMIGKLIYMTAYTGSQMAIGIKPLDMSLLECLEEEPSRISRLYKELEEETSYEEAIKKTYEYLPDYLRDSNELGLL